MAKRLIVLKNTQSGQELTLPVTPPSYPASGGRLIEQLDMAQTGQISLPGQKGLLNEQLEFMLPAQAYPFCSAGAVTEPSYYIDLLTAWSLAGQVCRYIVTGTGVNVPVLLGTLSYGEQDGSNDVYCRLPIMECPALEEAQVEQTGGRPVEGANRPAAPNTYVVAAGDTLSAICRRFYGDAGLAYKLAAANGVKNPNLIYPGQTLTLPEAETLMGYQAAVPPSVPRETPEEALDLARQSMGMSSRPWAVMVRA